MVSSPRRVFGLSLVVVGALAAAGHAAELGTFRIKEPLGVTWSREWITREVTIDASEGAAVRSLQVETTVERTVEEGGREKTVAETIALPSQFHDARTGRLLEPDRVLKGNHKLGVFFAAVLAENETAVFRVTDERTESAWPSVRCESDEGEVTVSNGRYVVRLGPGAPLDAASGAAGKVPLRFRFPDGVEAKGVRNEWIERGPARAILRRTFRFKGAAHRYAITFDFRADDPWIDVADEYSLGKGTYLRLDLSGMRPDVVCHPYAYNARTFKPGGATEDSTLQPPQHPIATLGPIWRDIWYGGGPHAFIYRKGGQTGIGLAAVRGSDWDAPDGVSLESQNLSVHGDRKEPGKVWVRIPTDGGNRRWAIVVGPPALRKRMDHMVRARADIPLQTVLDEWVLDWESDARPHGYGFAWQWFGPFNRHMLNPTTFPRGVRKHLRGLIESKAKVKSRDLAMLAYVFSNPNYLPGPRYKWKIGNPNFNTDMYNVVLQIGLLMPDHPHAKGWVAHGVRELKTNIERDSFPGGAWAESLSYSGFFFHVAEYAAMVAEAGAARPFRDWPRIKEVANYLACMHTPVDPRYASRQKAPIGDTSPGNYVRQLNRLAEHYRGIDDDFARKLAGFPRGGPEALDISSREFFGFGAMLRGSPYDERHESFVTVKAGPARNHFQGDELSFYFCSLSTPLALDYACHYSPRPWHAAMHNRPDMNDKRPAAVACRRAFAASGAADVFVADERTHRINEVPLTPHHTTKPGWEYPWSSTPPGRPWTMRRYVMLVKHDPKKSKLADYLVIRDEIESPESVWWNLHVLARRIERSGRRADFPGQLDVDLAAHFLTPKIEKIEKRTWGWGDSDHRGARKGFKGEAYEKEFFDRILPEDFPGGTWGRLARQSGEVGMWLRVAGPAGRSDWLVVLAPHRRGEAAPEVERLSATSARVTLGGESEVVHIGSEGKYQAAVERNGTLTVLLKAGQVKGLSQVSFTPVRPDIDRGGL
jgi:hypothetical protein